ncbi:hypothetical protein [Pedococcus bigeumensis]|uniref:hypothetical protein n=1 Tax=Pedococcus bigeumensis TaxID=433644 RepID=UPI001386844A|nr:hypothetical protein [Pedococcus bigeumensis]
MHRTLRSARTAAALALTLGVALVLPGAAFAGTTEPTPVTTTSTTSTGASTTAEPTGSTTTPAATSSTAGSTTTSSEPTTGTATGTPTGTTPTATRSRSTTSTTEQSTSPTAGLVLGGDSARYGLRAAAALPETSTDPTLVAAGFLERELATGGHHFSQTFDGVDYADYGLTLDGVLALDAAGAGQTEATAATAYAADHINEYIGPAYGATELYAGALAKALLVAGAQGVNPRAFGGVDLIASLQSLEKPSGRFSDKSGAGTPESPFADYSNLIGQSLAVMSLIRAGQTPSAASVSIIRANQCTDGGFSLSFGASPCTSDPDVTAFAVQALIAAAGTADADAGQGLDYLAGIQRAGGGVGGAGPTAEVNANSTGLAGQAFLAGGRSAQARAAQAYLRSVQYGCTAPVALRGGIAYNAAAEAAATAVTDQDRRATSQAVLALAGAPLFAVSATGADATAPDLACAATTSSTTSSTTTSTTTSTSSGGGTSSTSSPADPAAAPAASAAPGRLAFTGSNIAATLLVASLLLAAGVGAIVLARRKGAHA